MEDYNEFCSSSRSHLLIDRVETSFPRQQESRVASSIQFSGRPVLLPLLNKDQRKQMAQYRQQATALEAESQRLQRTSLLVRIQDILNGIQLCKVTDKQPACGKPGLVPIMNSSSSQPDHWLTAGGEEQEAETGESCPHQSVNSPSVSEPMLRVTWVDSGPWEGNTSSDAESENNKVHGASPSPGRCQQASYPHSPDSLLGSVSDSLTGLYTRLPSPRAGLRPAVHCQSSSPTSTGNILISRPVSAAELSPVISQHGRGPGRWDPVPVTEPPGGFNSTSAENLLHTPFKVSLSDSDVSVPSFITSDSFLNHPSPSPQPLPGRPDTPTHRQRRAWSSRRTPSPNQSPHSPSPRCRSSWGSSPAPLNRSYDVESPLPNLLRPHVGPASCDGQSPGLQVKPDTSPENSLSSDWSPGQVKHINMEPKASPVPSDSSRLTPSFLDSRPMEQGRTVDREEIQRQIEALEKMRRCLEEDHAEQLSLLISEQHREQLTLTQAEGLSRQASSVPPCGTPNLTPGRTRTVSPCGDPGTNRMVRNSCQPPAQSSVSFSSKRLVESSPAHHLGAPRPELQRAVLCRLGAMGRGFLTRRLLRTEKVKHLRKTVLDTKEFIGSLSTDSRRGGASLQVSSLQERGRAQLRAALYDVHEIFFVVPLRERLALIQQDRELHTERTLRHMEKAKSPPEKVVLSAATRKSLERKKQRMRDSLRQGRTNLKPKSFSPRILQPNQAQNTLLL
ncbi:hypothetical protein UPYG_G00328210 [Umbra pygmaea]|uniref:Centriolar coiled coil protein 110kDa n=1 Tax=Umbra pygmaea TaxID=75934 RepID=A0ABD0WH02_UMBPY